MKTAKSEIRGIGWMWLDCKPQTCNSISCGRTCVRDGTVLLKEDINFCPLPDYVLSEIFFRVLLQH